MPISTSTVRTGRTQKICTLWTHDENFSKEDVVFNPERFPELAIPPGSLAKIVALKPFTAVRDFQQHQAPQHSTTQQNVPQRDPSVETAQRSKSVMDGVGSGIGGSSVTGSMLGSGLGSGLSVSGSVGGAAGPRRPSLAPLTGKKARRNSVTIFDDAGLQILGQREVDKEMQYVFVCKAPSADLKAKHPNLQISVSETIAKAFGFRNRMQVLLAAADEESHSASHVEIIFRDQYIARADMWRLAISELNQKTVYKGQKLLFMGTIKASVKNVFVNGQTKYSAYFSSNTKPIFRSESARYVIFIQMSKEMWDFDTEGAGEIMFNKVVNGFLPELFKRWMKINARHLVTIVMFSRLEYDVDLSLSDVRSESTNLSMPFTPPSRDYYRVVVSEMASGDWIKILYQLKKEFKIFRKDVSLMPKTINDDAGGIGGETKPQQFVISGSPAPASKGNILEAINLAVSQFSKDYIDRDLIRTGISVIVITPGTGVHEVDYNMLKLTTDTLIGTGIGIDLVCLSPMPLHSVPLFKYRNPRLVSSQNTNVHPSDGRQSPSPAAISDDLTPRQTAPNFGLISSPRRNTKTPAKEIMDEFPPGSWSFAMPHWIDISFWSGPSDELTELSRSSLRSLNKARQKEKGFSLRCRMYELQMMGVMENELSNISIPFMHEDPGYPLKLKTYNENLIFTPEGLATAEGVSDQNQATQKTATPSPSGIRLLTDNEIKYGRYLNTQWMKMYDDQIFDGTMETMEEQRRKFLQPLEQQQHPTGRSRHASTAHESVLSSSFGLGTSLGTSARPPPEGNIHKFMGQRGGTRKGLLDMQPRYDDKADRKAALLVGDGIENSPPKPPRDSYKRPSMLHIVAEQPKRPASPLPFGKWLSEQEQMRPRSQDSGRLSINDRSKTQPLLTDKKRETKNTKAGDVPNRPSKFLSRHISFGGGKFALRADVSTAEVSGATAKGAELTGKPKNQSLLAAKAPAETGLLKTSATSIISPARSRAGSLARKLSQASMASAKPKEGDKDGQEKPTQPIAIKPGSHLVSALSRSPIPEQAAGSADTIKNIPNPKRPEYTQRSSETKDPSSLFLLAGSRGLLDQVGPKMDLSTSGGGPAIPKTLSPTSAISPWLVLVNPCNPKKNNMNVANQFRRWQHVFPRPLRASDIKWKSLCSPASVPLTNEYFPSPDQLATEYHESLYKVTQNDEDELAEVPKTREALVRELIGFRLSHGFQLLIGAAVAEVAGTQESNISNIFDENYMSHDGDTVFMSVGNTIHQLVCIAGGEVDVKRFNRKPTIALETSAGVDSPLMYRPYIRTQLETEYRPIEITLKPPREEYNWNFIDTFLAGYHDEFSDVLRFWRARFVLIPIEIPTNTRRPLTMVSEDSEEEIRIEGIRKLTQIWQKNRYIPPEERHFQAPSRRRKDPNPLMIEYQTRDPSAIVAAGPDSGILAEGDPQPFITRIFSDSELYNTSNIDLHKLAQDLQGEKGVPIVDRRWHWRLHYNCFVGSDVTTWLLQNFSDIDTREEAVELGNDLMKQGLFQHVQRRHNFRDGNFFYQIAAEYRAPRPESRTGWFGTRRIDRSVPSTPLADTAPKSSPLTGRSSRSSRPDSASSSSSQASSDDFDSSGEKTPTRGVTPKRKVALSHAMRYDVDPRRRSYRPEIINLHYDRLHNPDNCYHIRIDWMNVTAKLIEDSISTWATSVEKWGLRLVELPIAEASSIADGHPFRSPYLVKLALSPPKTTPQPYFDAAHFAPQTREDRFVYHKALLRKLNFVLDMEAASCFPSDVDVTYSWGRPDYRFTQYIHRSGVLLAQITDEGNFLLLANRLYNNRAMMAREAKTSGTAPSGLGSGPGQSMRSPYASPLVRPLTAGHANASVNNNNNNNISHSEATLNPPTPEELLDNIRTFCADANALRGFYDEALRPTASPSPRLAYTAVSEDRIPSLGLPPGILGREGSPWRKAEEREGREKDPKDKDRGEKEEL